MKTKSNLLSRIKAVPQSNWMMPALMAVALVLAVLGATGCSSPHPH